MLPTAVFVDGFLFAGTAVVLTGAIRELRLYNLAAGFWLVTGGWLGFWLFSDRSSFPGSPAIFILLGILAVGQIVSPLLMRGPSKDRANASILMSLGIAIVGAELGASQLLFYSGSTIATTRTSSTLLLFTLCLAAVIFFYLVLHRSRLWSLTALSARQAVPSLRTRLSIVLIVALEVGSLVLLGGCSSFIHKGIFGGATYRTLIPILAVLVAKGKPLLAGFLSGFALVLTHMLVVLFAGSAGGNAMELTRGFTLALLVLATVILAWPNRGVRKRNVFLPRIRSTLRLKLLPFTAIGVIGLAAGAFWLSHVRPIMVAWVEIHFLLVVSLLIGLSWMGQRFMGVETVLWPAVGALPLFLWSFQQNNLASFLLMSALLWVFLICCLTLLRSLDALTAIVVDLGLLSILHAAVKGLPWLSGEFEVLVLPKVPISEILLGLLPVVCLEMVALFPWLSERTFSMRALTLATASFDYSRAHGLPGFLGFVVLLVVLSCFGLVGLGSYFMAGHPLQPGIISLELGLTVLLFGYAATKWSLPIGVLAFFLLSLVLVVFFGDSSVAHSVSTGSLLIAAGLFVGLKGSK